MSDSGYRGYLRSLGVRFDILKWRKNFWGKFTKETEVTEEFSDFWETFRVPDDDQKYGLLAFMDKNEKYRNYKENPYSMIDCVADYVLTLWYEKKGYDPTQDERENLLYIVVNMLKS